MLLLSRISDMFARTDVIDAQFISTNLIERGPLPEEELNANAFGCGSVACEYDQNMDTQVRGENTPNGMQVW